MQVRESLFTKLPNFSHFLIFKCGRLEVATGKPHGGMKIHRAVELYKKREDVNDVGTHVGSGSNQREYAQRLTDINKSIL